MASAQVMKKQDLLAAGKKKLEEFRQKKALEKAEKAKKVTQSTQLQASSNGKLDEKPVLPLGNVRITSSEVAATSEEPNDVKDYVNSSHENLSLSSKDPDFRPNDDLKLHNKTNITNNHEVKKENDVTLVTDSSIDSKSNYYEDHTQLNNISIVKSDKLADITTSPYQGSITQRVDKIGPLYPTLSQIGDNKASDLGYTGLNIGATPPSNRRSRPSFLDSINVSSSSSSLFGSSLQNEPFAKTINPIESLGSGNEVDLLRNTRTQQASYLQKQNEDFAALEQHIEDLTQEKFSLQRALEASRTLAESLSAENSALTDTYNQQGSIVNQLKADMEMLQEEIKALLVELRSMKLEYAKVQLECDAADDRAKLLASEVIGLEEKVLRLRSIELKLERELENSQDEVSSLKKKMSSLEKERHDLQSTIDALQEEKKLMQSTLRKASSASNENIINKKDVSTSTQDPVGNDDVTLTRQTNNVDPTANLENDSLNIPVVDDNDNDNRPLNFDELSSTLPNDQMRIIHNITTLMSELAMEKEELIQSLSAELSQSCTLKESNKELTRKLEAQTQRLELLTSQNMVNDAITVPKQSDSRNVHDNTTYADEGDEVVERVLGWIMNIFPGGPSKTRTSKRV